MVFIRPDSMPIASCSTLASGARQLVVHEAFETTVIACVMVSWLTPYTTVASTSLSPGAEISTFFAPPDRCAEALALLVKRPVHSNTMSAPTEDQGSFDGSRS